MKIENIKLGTDPEVFLQKKSNGDIVSSIGIIKGSKQEPFPIGNGCHIQTDNILTEFCIPACTTPEEMYNYICYCISYTNKEVFNLGLQVKIQASARVDKEYLNNDQARQFGCEPDFNAWLQSINESPFNDTNLRSCGGHLHLGFDNSNEIINEQIVKALDLFLGVASMRIDTDTDRRSLYGKAGAFRFKDYGCEYRVLSNFWLKDIHHIKWIFEQTNRAIEFLNQGNSADQERDMIMTAINNNSREAQEQLIQKYDLSTEVKIKELI